MVSKRLSLLLVIASAITIFSVYYNQRRVDATCAFNENNQGKVTASFDVPSKGEYTIWSRVMVPSASDNSFGMSINNSSCINVGGQISPNQWTWINNTSSGQSNRIIQNLNAGLQTLSLVSLQPGVKIDRVLAVSNSGASKNCTPSGTGENCMLEADTTPPSVSIDSPPNGSIVKGKFNISIQASDNKTITKVEILLDGGVYNTLYKTPYSTEIDSSAITDGVHTIQARAHDDSGNIGTSSISTINVMNTPANKPPTVTLRSNDNNFTTPASIELTADAKDEDGTIARVEFFANNKLIGTSNNMPFKFTWSNMDPSNYSIYAKAIDDKGAPASSQPLNIVVSQQPSQPPITEDTQAPTKPKLSRNLYFDGNRFRYGIDLSWQASTDNVGVSKYILKRNNKVISETPGLNFKDLDVSANTRYNYSIEAQDAVGNTSEPTTTSIQASCFLIWCWEI